MNRNVFQRETRLDAHIHLRFEHAHAPLAQACARFLVIPAHELDVVVEHAEPFGVERDELTGEEEPRTRNIRDLNAFHKRAPAQVDRLRVIDIHSNYRVDRLIGVGVGLFLFPEDSNRIAFSLDGIGNGRGVFAPDNSVCAI